MQAAMTGAQARTLTARLRRLGLRAAVRRHRPRTLARARSLEAFIRPYLQGAVAYDPTGVFERARCLVQFAVDLRRGFPGDVRRLLWQGHGGVLYVVLSRHRLPNGVAFETRHRESAEAAIRALLERACAGRAASFVRSVRVGFADPEGAATPVDSLSVPSRMPLFERPRRGLLGAIAALAGIAAPAAPVLAQPLPAVSGVNSEIGVIAGQRNGTPSFLLEGATTIPVGDGYGLRVDGLAGAAGNELVGGGAAHLFWRNPELGLFGIAAGYVQSTSSPGIGVIAGEGEAYLGDFTLSGLAGYQFSSAPAQQGPVGRLELEWYATEDLMFSAGLETNPQQAWLARGGVEYRPGLAALPGLTLFAEGALGENNYHRAYVGLRFYFGDSEALKDRHRQDTFRTHLLPTRMTDAAPIGAAVYGN